MSDWQKDDLALCVHDQDCPVYPGSNGGIKRGNVYTVTEVRALKDVFGRECIGLQLDRDNVFRAEDGVYGYHNHIRFIKVTPPKDLAEEPRTEEVVA